MAGSQGVEFSMLDSASPLPGIMKDGDAGSLTKELDSECLQRRYIVVISAMIIQLTVAWNGAFGNASKSSI